MSLNSSKSNNSPVESTCVAILDDDHEIRALVVDYLEQYGIHCIGVESFSALQRLMSHVHLDLLLLDIMLPDGDGLKICQRLRDETGLPIILLTALADESDRVVGLEMGADDYLTKPFSARELLARIRAVLRRTSEQLWIHRYQDVQRYSFAGWSVSVAARSLRNPQGVLVSLTGGEFDLLLALLAHAGKVLSREQLLELTKGRVAQAFDRSIDVQLSRLRRKLDSSHFIKTVRGGGYVFVEPVNSDDG